jgi:hypothetical protein
MLKTGTEHWGTIYDQTIGNPRQGMSMTGGNFNKGSNANNTNPNNNLDQGMGG